MSGAAWVILSWRYGDDSADPTDSDFEAALREVFEQYPDDHEHPDAWLRYGFDDGPMYVLTFFCDRTASFEEWADQDHGSRLAPEREARDVTLAEALALCKQLASGDLEAVRTWRWIMALA